MSTAASLFALSSVSLVIEVVSVRLGETFCARASGYHLMVGLCDSYCLLLT